MPIKKWKLLPYDSKASAGLAAQFCEELGISPLCAQILIARGVRTLQQAQDRLGLAPFKDPLLLPDMARAVQRIQSALDNGERICIYGDYDCDGITSTTVLYNYLETVGADVMFYIPDRHQEGYGMNRAAVRAIAKQGVQLIITVDNGISAFEEVAYAGELGMDVVVTDHHEPPGQLPDAAAVVDPHRKDCPAGFEMLAGVGVAFKLICALEGDETGESMLEQYGDLVCLGTVADVVPLVGENRAIVSYGLRILENTDNPGLRALLEVSGLADKALSAHHVAFGLAPRINAVSRLADAKDAVRLLLCEDEEEALELAGEISRTNTHRKELEQQVLEEIQEQIQKNPQAVNQRVLVFWGENWHPGVIGIVCAKLVERYLKPCILISVQEKEARGSARSVEGFSIIEAIRQVGDCLTKFGGHNQAAGFSLAPEHIGEFAVRMNDYARRKFGVMPLLELKIDRLVTPSQLTLEEISRLSELGPFGCGNEEPVFALRHTVLEQVQPLSEGKHVKLRLRKNKESFPALYFGMPAAKFPYQIGEELDCVVQCEENEYMGVRRVSIRILDLHCSKCRQNELFESKQLYERLKTGEELSADEAAQCLPSRQETAMVFRYLRKNPVQYDYELLAQRMQLEEPSVSYAKTRVSLDALEELGLITQKRNSADELLMAAPVAGAPKADLASAPLLRQLERTVKHEGNLRQEQELVGV